MKTVNRLIMSASVMSAVAFACVAQAKEPVDWVNTEIGTISHMLVPCFQTVQRPNAMLRFLPPYRDYTQDRVGPLKLQPIALPWFCYTTSANRGKERIKDADMD